MRKSALYGISLLIMGVVALLILKGADLALGAMATVRNPIATPGITAVRYQTSEFDITARFNAFGFRGTQTAIRPGQIAALGDSFTFGWGLDERDSWVAKLQAKLRSAGRDLDVYNLGQPGTDTIDQIEIARTYVPMLKPSVLILTLVQGDDLAGIVERDLAPGQPQVAGYRQKLKALAEATFPNLLLTSFRLLRGTQDATANWRQLTADLIRARGLSLDPEMSREAEAGHVNPFLLTLAAYRPERNDGAYGPAPEAVAARRRLIDAVGQLSRLVAANGGKLAILSMPAAPFVESVAMRNHRRIGFKIAEASLSGHAPDLFATELCREVQARCILALDEMRALARREEPFFPLDGHINAAGSTLVADLVAGALTSAP